MKDFIFDILFWILMLCFLPIAMVFVVLVGICYGFSFLAEKEKKG